MDLEKIVGDVPSQYSCSLDAINHLDEIVAPFSSVHIVTREKIICSLLESL
jgi:hypothetical protein